MHRFPKQQNNKLLAPQKNFITVFLERPVGGLLEFSREPMDIERKGCWLDYLENNLSVDDNIIDFVIERTPPEISKLKLAQNTHTEIKRQDVPQFDVGEYDRVLDNENVCSKDGHRIFDGKF